MEHSARLVAFDALIRVTVDDAYLDRVLPTAFERSGLSPEDRGLCNELCYGVLRRRALLDQRIARYLDRPLAELDPPTLMALRLGAYQLLLLERVPPHAAVSETVNVIKLRRKSAQGLVNAVLRKISQAEKTSVEPSAAELPPWLYERLCKARPPLLDVALQWQGPSAASEAELLRALSSPAHPSLRVLSQRLSREALLQRLTERGANAWPLERAPCGVGVSKIGDVATLDGFGHDLFAQDEAAQWVMELVRGERGPSLDACAAPGGKTLALWDLGLQPVTALEVQPNRRALLDKTLSKAKVPATVVTADAARPPPGEFATVLVDAPCTGSGTLRRHPELRWRMQQSDITRLGALQRDILQGVSSAVAPGGTLVYSVCSVFDEEGPQQVRAFLEEHSAFTLERWLETRSAMHVMDGFFAAKLRRKA